MFTFVSGLSLPPHRRDGASDTCKAPISMSQSGGPGKTRRALLRDFAALAAAAFAGVPQTLAGVNFDVDRFGDKELKVSAINKVKQNCRNVLATKPELLPVFFLLGVKDALSYDANTNDGGLNGSIAFELSESYNADLKDAVDALREVRTIQREQMSLADTISFAGATAIEVSGGPRIRVQLGREDATEADPPGASPLFVPGASAADLSTYFSSAGLDPASSVVLVHGALGALTDIAEKKAAELAELEESDLEEEEDVTYGRVSGGKRGPVLVSTNVSTLTLGGGKFSNAYLKALLKQDASKLSERDRIILNTPQMKAELTKYASNNNLFVNDLANLYERLTLLGSVYENEKLLGST